MSTRQYPSAEYLLQCFDYRDGMLFWRTRPREHFESLRGQRIFNRKFAGKEAGAIRSSPGNKHDRWVIRIGVRNYRRSHLVWAIHRGNWEDRIDHKNRDSLDDKIGNLRVATQSQNIANSTINSRNTSGYKGVYFEKRRGHWIAAITVDYAFKYLGSFDTPQKAHLVYMEAARKHFGEFACNGEPLT